MSWIELNEIEEREIIPGFHVRFVHSENMTLAYWRVDEGAKIPEHSHPHEQVVNLIEGRFELVIDGQARQVEPGSVALIPGGVSHSGRALSDCRIIDVFHPVREDYLA
ncbi:cupin domain-containing protein [bacterium]|nr:cupin domain-containing protein [bacterium]